jgi:tetratricopeptide (TPR) repeat protein
MRPILVALAALALTLAPGAPALAQRRPEKPAGRLEPRLAEAKKLFEDGADAYTQGNYEAAIAAWEKSYEISKKPLIFESIANAYERLGNPKKAREYLARWREVAPAEEQGILDARLKNLDARVAREEEAEAARKAEEEKKKREREQQEQAAKGKQGALPLPGLVLAGSGGVAVIIGVALDIAASGKRPDAKACGIANNEQICLTTARDQISASNTLATVGDVLWIAGLAAAAGGVALIFTQKSKPTEGRPPTTAFLPMVTPRSAGFLLERRF